jgi:hypothetical protein
MVRDEAPAATPGGVNEMAETAWRPARPGGRAAIPVSDPTSFVAAEIHLGHRPTGICDGWLHCNIQVACHPTGKIISRYFKWLSKRHRSCEVGFITASRQFAYNLAG